MYAAEMNFREKNWKEKKLFLPIKRALVLDIKYDLCNVQKNRFENSSRNFCEISVSKILFFLTALLIVAFSPTKFDRYFSLTKDSKKFDFGQEVRVLVTGSSSSSSSHNVLHGDNIFYHWKNILSPNFQFHWKLKIFRIHFSISLKIELEHFQFRWKLFVTFVSWKIVQEFSISLEIVHEFADLSKIVHEYLL